MENHMCVTLGNHDTLEDGSKSRFVNPLVLEGNDVGKSHAIATVQNHIFDSNCEFSMKLNKEKTRLGFHGSMRCREYIAMARA